MMRDHNDNFEDHDAQFSSHQEGIQRHVYESDQDGA